MRCMMLGLVAVLATACVDADGTETAIESAELSRACRDVRADRLGMVVVDRLHAALTQAVGPDGFAALLDDDVVFEAPGEDILRGKAAVHDYLRRVDPTGAVVFTWDITRADVGRSGDLGYTFGWTTETTTAADGTRVIRHGKYMNVWRRSSHRGWRLLGHGRVRGVDITPGPAPEGLTFFPDDGRRCLPAQDPDAARAAMIGADGDFAALSRSDGVAVAFGTYSADDGVLLAAGAQIIFGRDAIVDVYDDTPPNESLDWWPVTGAVASSGDQGFTVGEGIYTVADPAGDQRFYSKYLTVWERQADGSWRFVVDGGSARPAPAP